MKCDIHGTLQGTKTEGPDWGARFGRTRKGFFVDGYVFNIKHIKMQDSGNTVSGATRKKAARSRRLSWSNYFQYFQLVKPLRKGIDQNRLYPDSECWV